jgi:hypothetical protein
VVLSSFEEVHSDTSRREALYHHSYFISNNRIATYSFSYPAKYISRNYMEIKLFLLTGFSEESPKENLSHI